MFILRIHISEQELLELLSYETSHFVSSDPFSKCPLYSVHLKLALIIVIILQKNTRITQSSCDYPLQVMITNISYSQYFKASKPQKDHHLLGQS